MDVYHSRSLMPKVLGIFALSLVVSLVGLYFGQYVPPQYVLHLSLVEFFLAIMVLIMRERKTAGYTLMYLFMFVSGVTLYSVLAYYINEIGASSVFKAFVITVVTFSVSAVYASLTKRDFSFLRSFLFTSLILLIILGIVNIFWPFQGLAETAIAGFGVFIFIGYTLYDFNRMSRQGISDEDIPGMVLNIYLDFINLFLYILRLMASFAKD